MKMYVDINKTFGKLVFLKTANWIDFNTKELKGVKVFCGSIKTFEQLEIRIKGLTKELFEDMKEKQEIQFDEIIANTWAMNRKNGVTFSANEVLK
ncbi:hypothetical protein R4Y62_002574 [Enterococcus faecalis]|nr:hypothetical protein [Enterococcus faecalis]